jgi:hypothetical protein
MAAWQMQCCGTPFKVGDDVTWTLLEGSDSKALSQVLGPQLADQITHVEEHHGRHPEDAPTTTGRVKQIRTVAVRYESTASDVAVSVPGSAKVIQVEAADGHDTDPGDGRLVGYLVDLDA